VQRGHATCGNMRRGLIQDSKLRCPSPSRAKATADQARTAFCTIVAKNYLAFARVLASPCGASTATSRHVLLIDEVAGYFDPRESFAVLRWTTSTAAPTGALFRYELIELATAVSLLPGSASSCWLSTFVYLDPDVRFYAPSTSLFWRPAHSSHTPHHRTDPDPAFAGERRCCWREPTTSGSWASRQRRVHSFCCGAATL